MLALALSACTATGASDTTDTADPVRPTQLPEVALGRIPTTVLGKIRAFYLDDFEVPGNSRAIYELHEEHPSGNGEVFRLDFPGAPPDHVEDGARIRVFGDHENGSLRVAEANGDGSSSVEVVEVAEATVSGAQRAIVIVGDLSNQTVACSVSQIRSLMFDATTSVNQYFQESSEGSVSFSGEVVGPFTLSSFDSTSCDYSAWGTALDAEATKQGVNLSDYNRKIYVVPRGSCSFAGVGTIGGNPSRSWVTGYCQVPDVYAHELGHNFTMHHASTPTSEYDDRSCIMGIGGIGLRQPNAPHQLEMGWLGGLAEANAPGRYAVGAVETAAAPQVIQIPRTNAPDLYVSYRVPLGFDATQLPSAYRNRVSIHEWNGGTANKTFLRGVLDVGQSYTDPQSGATITVAGMDGTLAQLDVSYGCTVTSPSLSVTPTTLGSGPGGSLSYTLTVTNRDGLGCEARSLDLATHVPTGWSADPGTSALTLPPGSSESITVSVGSPPTAIDGAYPITFVLSESGVLQASTSASYTVDATPPSAPANLRASVSRNQVSLAWDAALDNIQVAGYRLFRDGALLVTLTTLSYGDRSITKGQTYVYEVEAFDTAGHTSARSNSLSVTTSGSGGGGGGGRGGKPPKK